MTKPSLSNRVGVSRSSAKGRRVWLYLGIAAALILLIVNVIVVLGFVRHGHDFDDDYRTNT